MKKQTNTLLTATALLLFAGSVAANNIKVSNIRVTGQNTTAGVDNAANYSLVQFDLSWENSWRTSSAPNNWDAAWVFVKYRITTANGGDDLWKHAWLNDAGHSGTNATIDAGLLTPGSAFNANSNPGIGVFIYRSANGTGTFSISNAQLRWNYGANGITDNATVDVRVFAIEMVYVPQGNFTVGTTGYDYYVFTAADDVSNPHSPFTITSTAPTLQGNYASSSPSNLSATGNFDLTGTTTASLASGFPTGYTGFYCQKYEITQQQYVDFLNTLTRTQQNSRTGTSLAAGTTSVTNRYVMFNTNTMIYRNGIRCDSSIHTSNPINFYCDLNGNGTGGESNDGQWIACNFLSWMDGAAYSDWAGLRPMTELEYEKACRGTVVPVADEYAWGNTTATAATNITNPGTNNETTTTLFANAVFSFQTDVKAPVRVGFFAKSGTIRVLSGASYYGIMELSGNLREQSVTVGDTTGRAFTGVHGNGVLSTNGHANETAWPGLTSGEVTGAAGSGFRGGSWNYNFRYLRVSDRVNAATPQTGRSLINGFRAVRRVP
jgi:formylglycine-generating enzyme required for sulfatase activity